MNSSESNQAATLAIAKREVRFRLLLGKVDEAKFETIWNFRCVLTTPWVVAAVAKWTLRVRWRSKLRLIWFCAAVKSLPSIAISRFSEAVAIRDGRFIAVGTDRDMRPLTGPGTRVIDLAGRTVIPGLIDSHIYATVAGLSWDDEIHWEMTQYARRRDSDKSGSGEDKAGRDLDCRWWWLGADAICRAAISNAGADLDALAPNHPVYIQYLRQGALAE